MNIKEQT